MNEALKKITITDFSLKSDKHLDSFDLTYQIFGPPLFTAPIVMAHHALTGNSNVADAKTGWWNALIGKKKAIDTQTYTVIAFNIPGNGYDGTFIDDYRDWSVTDVAELYLLAIEKLNIKKIYANIGGSLGGNIVWEMSALAPDLCQYIIPIATDWKATDWVIAHCFMQDQLLKEPIANMGLARYMGMMFYRTPQSFQAKFHRGKQPDNPELFQVESWLNHHAKRIGERFDIRSYRMMNQLLKSACAAENEEEFKIKFKKLTAHVIQIGISSDWIFVPQENLRTKQLLNELHIENDYYEIQSPHGHDAFLIEYQQLTEFIKPYFK